MLRPTTRTAPRLDQLMTLQAKTITRDAAGQEIEVWSGDAAVWVADWIPTTRGYERFTAQQPVAMAQRVFRMRYRDGVTPTHRLLAEDGTAWNILNVRPIGRGRWLELDVTTRAEDAP